MIFCFGLTIAFALSIIPNFLLLFTRCSNVVVRSDLIITIIKDKDVAMNIRSTRYSLFPVNKFPFIFFGVFYILYELVTLCDIFMCLLVLFYYVVSSTLCYSVSYSLYDY